MKPLSLNMGKLSIPSSEDCTAHWLYDLSIDDIDERREKKQLFKSARSLSAFIGVPADKVYEKRARGHRIFSPKNQRWYAIRIAH